jgi:uncharacterized protein (DUF4213/DUF364 family)
MYPNTSDFWHLYDSLIDGIAEDATIRAFAGGLHWFAVRSEHSLGLSMGPAEGLDSVSLAGQVTGHNLRAAASLAKSWNWADASLGMAAINAWYNEPARVNAWAEAAEFTKDSGNIFELLLPRLRGKKVVVIGHFRGLDALASCCQLTVLERQPRGNDLPDPACELVLPQADYVIITGTTMLNKTLPRLLALARNAYVVLAGPTTTLWPGWFEHGVDLLAGVIVEDPDRVFQQAQEGGSHNFFGRGARMVNLTAARGQCSCA